MKKHKTNKAKRVDSQCKNNGACPACKSNRLHQQNKGKHKTKEQLNEWRMR